MKKVGIVVVTYNRLELLKEVIDALRQQTYQDFQIIVVNNGSTDETPSWLKQQKDIITITQENLGGAGGFHTGMKYVAEHDYEYCWIMDDDVICSDNALKELMNAYEIDPNAGFICSRVLGIEGFPMNTPEPFGGKIDAYSDIYEKVVSYAMVKVRSSTFVSVLFKTSVIFQFGLPYKEYFIWGDDSEYTARISSVLPCYVACKSEVLHKRAIQKRLLFENEKDPQRIRNYYYMFRNQGHYQFVGQSKMSKIRHYIGNLKKSQILFKVFWDLLSFSPQVIYPERNLKNSGRDEKFDI